MSDAQAVISILGDVSEYLESIQKAGEATGEFAEKAKEGVSELSEKLKEVAEFAGFVTTLEGLKEVAEHALESAEQVEHLSQSLGMATQTIQTMGFAAGMVGGSLDDVSQSLAKMERSAAMAASGNAQSAEAFRALGVSAAELPELLKQPDELMLKLAEGAGEAADGVNKTAAIIQVFGRGAAQMIPFLNELAKNYEELKQKSIDFGVTLDGPAMAAMEETNTALNTMKLAGEGLANQFTEALAPAIAGIADALTSLSQTGAVKGFFSSMGEDIRELIVIGGQLKDMFSTGLNAALEALGIDGKRVFDGMGGDVVSFIVECQDDFAQIVRVIQVAWANIETGGELVWIGIKGVFDKFLDDTLNEIAGWASKMANSFGTLGMDTLAAKFNSAAQSIAGSANFAADNTAEWNDALQRNANAIKAADDQMNQSIQSDQAWGEGVRITANATKDFTEQLDAFKASLAKGDLEGNEEKLKLLTDDLNNMAKGMIASGGDAAKVTDSLSASLHLYQEAVEKADAATVDYNAHVKQIDTEKMAEALAAGLAKWNEENAKLLGTLDPITKATEEYNAQIMKAEQSLVPLIKNGLSWGDAITMLQDRETLLEQAERRSIDAFNSKLDVLGALEHKYQDQILAVGQLTNAGQAAAEVDKTISDELKKLSDAYGANSDIVKKAAADYAAHRDATIADVTAMKDHIEAVKEDADQIKQWVGIAQSGFDNAFAAITKDIVEGGSVMSDLANVAKQTVEQIIEYFLKLEIINPILNSIFGLSGTSMQLPSGLGGLTSLLSGGANGSGGLGSLLGSASQGNGLLGQLMGNSWVQNIIGSTGGTGSGLMGLLFGGSGGFDMLGAAGGDLVSAGAVGDVGAWMTQGIPGAGGVFGSTGATSGLFGSGGDVMGGLGNLGSVLGGAFAGWQLGSQLGGTAGGIAGAAALAYASYMIPVVGWIAGAASLINSFTGGDLFGTSYKPTGTTFLDMSTGPGGLSMQDLVQEHKHGAFFSGGSYRDVSVPLSADQLTNQNSLNDQITQALASAGTILGVQAGTLIASNFKEQFDSSGKNTGGGTTTIGGETFKDTDQQYVERVISDSLLAMLPASQNAMEIAKNWQSSADTLYAGTTMLIQAQADINHGMSLLGSDTSLKDIADVVEKLAQKGEALTATYTRLQTEQTDLAAILDNLGMTTGKTGADFVTFADQLTQAAGGLSNLNTAWNNYYKEYYTAAEQQANTMKQLQTAVTSTFTAIGQDPNESMAQFRANFTAAMPNLTAAQVTQWLAASQALYTLDAALAAIGAASANSAAVLAANQAKYDTFVDQFDPNAVQLTAFEQALQKLETTLEANVTQANALATAAGMAGVDSKDLGNIIANAAEQGVTALKSFEAQAQQLATSLYGTNVSNLQSQLTALQAADKARLAGVDPYTASQLGPALAAQEAKLQAQIDAANAQAEAAKRLTDATTLLGDFAQIGAVTGGSLDSIASTMGVPLDKMAADLGETTDQLRASFTQQEAAAVAALQTAMNTQNAAQYLADIRDILAGRAPGTTIAATPGIIGDPTKPVPVTAEAATLAAIAGVTSAQTTSSQTVLDTAKATRQTSDGVATLVTVFTQLVQAVHDGTANNTSVGQNIIAALTGASIRARAQTFAQTPRSVITPIAPPAGYAA